jgi:hypothetical protein
VVYFRDVVTQPTIVNAVDPHDLMMKYYPRWSHPGGARSGRLSDLTQQRYDLSTDEHRGSQPRRILDQPHDEPVAIPP